jgi:gamma-glutamylcyclotransferase (GGCT)/AIG2-like uncharacterized protein YtfP
MVKVLVYGSLRKGYINYINHLSAYEPIRTFRLYGFKMYDLGGYPTILIDDGVNSIVVEEYDVSKSVFDRLMYMENGAGYNTGIVTMPDDDNEYYIFYHSYIDKRLFTCIEGGDYSVYIKSKGY